MLVTACALFFALAAAASIAGEPVVTVKVAFQPFQSFGGLFIADREQYFAAERIRVEWVPATSGGQGIALLLNSQIDVGGGGAAAALYNAVSRGLKIRIVADKGHVEGRGDSGAILVRKDLARTVRSLADLKGRRISIGDFGSLGHYVLARALATVGMRLNEIEAVTLPPPAIVAALQGGAIDAGFLAPPLDAHAVELGAAVRLLDVADFMSGEPTAFLFYGPTLLDRNPDLGRRFLVAYLRGVRRLSEGPTARNVAIVADYTKVDPATVRKGGWTPVYPDGFVDVAKLRRHQDWMFEIGLIDVRNPIGMVIDTGFVEHARAVLNLPGR